MKNFSRPPDEQSDEEKWKLLFSDILSSHVISEKDKYNTLDDKKGLSIVASAFWLI